LVVDPSVDMSYRTLKRLLGETSLERKIRFLFGASLLLLITGSFWWYGTRTEKIVNAQADRSRARENVNYVLLRHHLMHLETDKSWRRAQESLADMLQAQDYQWKFIRTNHADGQGKPVDETEWEVLDKFNKPPPEHEAGGATPLEFAEYRYPDRNEYHYYQPVRWNQGCYQCHSNLNQPPGIMATVQDAGLETPLNLGRPSDGDLMAVVKIVRTSPDPETQKSINWNRALLMSISIVAVFLAMMALYIIVRYVIVKPLKHLRDVSDAVARGEMDQRAEIRTGDEFEELAVAFNRMLRHLTEAQQELRHVNRDLDSKVDELAEVNMKLYETNRLKGDFLATISHELRTPLNSILGFSDVLGSIDSLDERQKRYVQNIRSSGQMLLSMINDILDLAKLESGKMEVHLGEVLLPAVLAAQCDMARPLTEKKNIDLEVDVPHDLPPMHQDQAKIQQILNNLLSNAIKFTPEGGRIIVRARRDGQDQLRLAVIDTGVGIAEEDQQAIFEKFRQGKAALGRGDAMTREYSGTGLGLSIIKELCRLLGGSIEVESTLGKGSTFTVHLPWVRQEQPKLESPLAEDLGELTRPAGRGRVYGDSAENRDGEETDDQPRSDAAEHAAVGE